MMSYDEAERLCQRLQACGWRVYLNSWNVFGSRCYLLASHATFGNHRIETEYEAARWLVRVQQDQEANNG